MPVAEVVGFLVRSQNPNTNSEAKEAHAALDAKARKLVVADVGPGPDFEAAFDTLVRQGTKAICVQADQSLILPPNRLVRLADAHALPAVYSSRDVVAAGGLMSYRTSSNDAYRILGGYAARILKGERAGDLPVQQSVKVELAVNLQNCEIPRPRNPTDPARPRRRGDRMRRREFITLLGGAAAAWPLVARAQQPAMPVVGFLQRSRCRLREPGGAFRQGLKEAGFVEGQNVTIEYRWADGQIRSAAGAGGRFGSPSGGSDRRPAATRRMRAKAAISTIPIIFATGGDPVELGLVASLNRPGGNITGVTLPRSLSAEATRATARTRSQGRA